MASHAYKWYRVRGIQFAAQFDENENTRHHYYLFNGWKPEAKDDPSELVAGEARKALGFTEEDRYSKHAFIRSLYLQGHGHHESFEKDPDINIVDMNRVAKRDYEAETASRCRAMTTARATELMADVNSPDHDFAILLLRHGRRDGTDI